MKNGLIIFSMIVALASQGQSQYALSVSNGLMSDTAFMGSVLGYSIEIENSGTDTICWPVDIFVSVNASYWELNTVVFFDSFCFAPGDVILIDWPAIDTVNSLILGGFIDVSEERSFVSGDNVIVVWPAITDSSFANQGHALESEQFINSVFVINSTTIDEQEKQPIDLYVDRKTIIIKSALLQHYELYDLTGRRLLKGTQSTIDCNGLKGGVYTLCVLQNNGQYQTLKVMIP